MNPLSFSDYCTHLAKKGKSVNTAQEDHVKLIEKIIFRNIRKARKEERKKCQALVNS